MFGKVLCKISAKVHAEIIFSINKKSHLCVEVAFLVFCKN